MTHWRIANITEIAEWCLLHIELLLRYVGAGSSCSFFVSEPLDNFPKWALLFFLQLLPKQIVAKTNCCICSCLKTNQHIKSPSKVQLSVRSTTKHKNVSICLRKVCFAVEKMMIQLIGMFCNPFGNWLPKVAFCSITCYMLFLRYKPSICTCIIPLIKWPKLLLA